MALWGLNLMNPLKYKALFIAITAILALLVASPALHRALVYPQTEFFTEMSLIGSTHSASNYPYNITTNKPYTVYLGLTNRLGSSAYYEVQIKFRNQSQSAPDTFNHTSSSLPSLYNLYFVVADKESLGVPFSFSFNYVRLGLDEITFNNMTINNEVLNLSGLTSSWNSTQQMTYGNLIFELWLYNSTSNVFQYNERFVDLKFNMTTV
jgi:hypothetical protein